MAKYRNKKLKEADSTGTRLRNCTSTSLERQEETELRHQTVAVTMADTWTPSRLCKFLA